jgi:hypothetical protein
MGTMGMKGPESAKGKDVDLIWPGQASMALVPIVPFVAFMSSVAIVPTVDIVDSFNTDAAVFKNIF